MGRLEDSDSVNKTDATPGEEFIRSFTQSQRALYLFILPMVGNSADADEVLQETNLVRKHSQLVII